MVTIFAAQITDQDSNDPPDNMAANFVFSFTMDAAPAVDTLPDAGPGREPTVDELLSALRAFEITATRYDEHQRAMEDYWSLRWLSQERIASAPARVLRESLVRLEGLPLVVRVPSLPALDPGTRVSLEIKAIDLIERNVSCVFREILGSSPVGPVEGMVEKPGI